MKKHDPTPEDGDTRALSRRFLLLQYLIGLVVTAVFSALVLLSDVPFHNIRSSTDSSPQADRWFSLDTRSYVSPARNFLSHGVFGYGDCADVNRTIGYPAFLAFMMHVFGENWIVAVIVIQCLLCPLIYPALSIIASRLLGRQYPHGWLFIFSLVSGAYFTRSCYILSDLPFAIFLVVGLAFGLTSMVRSDGWLVLLHLLFIGVAAQIRPTLCLYPILFLLAYAALNKKDVAIRKRHFTKTRLVVSLVLLAIICNLPILRNYINRGLASPSIVLSTNMFNIAARATLREVGRPEEYQSLVNTVKLQEELAQKDRLKKKLALQVYRKYPWQTMRNMFGNAGKLMGSNHWLPALHYWEYDWWYFHKNGRGLTNNSTAAAVLTLAWAAVYLGVYSVFAKFLLRLWFTEKRYLLLGFCMIFIGYFMIPTFIAGGAPRLRLPAEWLIVMCAIYEIAASKRFSKITK